MPALTDPRVRVTPFTRWVTPDAEEVGAPDRRILHATSWDAEGRTLTVAAVGIRRADGYYYCGTDGGPHPDWAQDVAVYALDGQSWTRVLVARDLPEPQAGDIHWLALDAPVATTALVVHIRRAGVGGWWSPWNLADTGLVIDAELDETPPVRVEPTLTNRPDHDSVTWDTGRLRASFSLRRPALTGLEIDAVRPSADLLRPDSLEFALQRNIHQFANGPALRAVGRPQLIGGLLKDQAAVAIDASADTVTYSAAAPGVRLTAEWTPVDDGLRLTADLEVDRDTLFWNADLWTLTLNPRVRPAVHYGETLEEGAAGRTSLPAQLDFPMLGEVHLTGSSDVTLRTTVARAALATSHALEIGSPDPVAGTRVAAGRYRVEVTLGVPEPRRFRSTAERPATEAIVSMVEAVGSSALPYRQDTASLANNGASQQVPLCLDSWSALAIHLGPLLPDRDILGMLRHTLERWLDLAPGYAAGTVEMEQSYIMTRASALTGLATYLRLSQDDAWFAERREQIAEAVAFTRALDADGDGLIESPIRLGISGDAQWSSNWWDVVSFGHQDAFTNAILHPALRELADWYESRALSDQARELHEWADLLKSNYVPTFLNPETGWLGGWRSPDGVLHDYAFLFVNGAAVVGGLLDDALAADIVDRLARELDRVGFRRPEFGLPGNLRSIDDADMPDVARNRPYESYENGSATLSQARWFVDALYAVGRRDEADALLAGFARGFLEGYAIGGVDSGGDWRRWDGSPSGYEGILSDQFAVLATAIREFGVTR